jgi:hypothetical protein
MIRPDARHRLRVSVAKMLPKKRLKSTKIAKVCQSCSDRF